MSTLYVTEVGVQVHTQGQRLLVKRGAEVLQDIPLIKIDRVVLVGKSVGITTPTLYALSRRKIGVYYLNSRGGHVLHTAGQEHKHSQLRQEQIRACDQPQRALAAARAIVTGKIQNQRVLVQRHTGGAGWARAALDQMDAMRRQVEEASTLDELRGREGLAARQYFHLLRQIFRTPADGQSWGFAQRVYYPPTDPINALLSFGYTLLLNETVAACQITGLDPDIGFFHAVDYNKPSMALDLEEEFRPAIVDSIVLAAINRPIFRLSDFETGQPRQSRDDEEDEPADLAGLLLGAVSQRTGTDAGKAPPRPVYLKDSARNRFISLYEARLNEVAHPLSGEQTSYRRILELQTYAMARFILGRAERYVPFTIR